MKNIQIRYYNHKTICTLKLGSVYRLTSAYNDRALICRFIKTTAKGFNMLNVRTSKCIFKNVIYQTDSAKKKVGARQQIFEMALPDYIRKIQELNEHDNCEELLEEKMDKIEKALVKKYNAEPSKITNPLQRIEL